MDEHGRKRRLTTNTYGTSFHELARRREGVPGEQAIRRWVSGDQEIRGTGEERLGQVDDGARTRRGSAKRGIRI